MSDNDSLILYAAAFDSVDAAEGALDVIEQLHDNDVVGHYDAAVIDNEKGKPHIVKRADHPYLRVIPEWFGGGTLPRKELHTAAEHLTADSAGLIVIGEPTIQKALDNALAGTGKVVKQEVNAAIDQISSELQEALKV